MAAWIEIRPVMAADLVGARDMLVETWHHTYDAIYGAAKVEEITSRWHTIEVLAAQAQKTDSVFLVATDGKDIVASSYAQRVTDGAVQLYRLYVHPRTQGKGLGGQLMAATFVPFGGGVRQRLEVEPANSAAIAFYERAGFVLNGRTSDCGGASGIPALIYERTAL